MKKAMMILAAAAITAASAFAQSAPKVLKGGDPGIAGPKAAYQRAGLSDEEIAKVESILAKLRDDVTRTDADAKVAEANAQRLLADPRPDMAQVEKALKPAYDAQLKIRMLGLKAAQDIRAAVGEGKWLALRPYLSRNGLGMAGPAPMGWMRGPGNQERMGPSGQRWTPKAGRNIQKY